MFLYESDYEWAMKFCSKIINHPNYIEIKKIIGDLEIKVVREYHNLIVNRINDDLDKYKLFIYNLNILTKQAMSISKRVGTCGAITLESKKDVEEYEKAFDNIYGFLTMEDSPILLEANRKYDIVGKTVLEESNFDLDLVSIYENEKAKLEDYIYSDYYSSYNRFLLQKNKYESREKFNYPIDLGLKIHRNNKNGIYGKSKRIKIY